MANSGFPHPTFVINDLSTRVPFVPVDTENLFAPFIPFFAEKGPVNSIQYSGDISIADTYGSRLIEHGSPYYTLSNGLVDRALNGPNPVAFYGVRLADPAATKSNMVITCTPTPMAIPQYETDGLGNRTLDANGNPIPLLQADGKTPVTEPGLVLLYQLRRLADDETVSTAKVTTTGTGDSAISTYPIIAAEGSSVGALLNNCGLKLYRPSTPSTDIEGRIGAVMYRFAPYFLNSSLDTTASPVADNSGNAYNDITFKPNATDPLTSLNYSFSKVLYSKYYDSNSAPLLDMSLAVYSDNVKAIGDQCLAVSTELAGLVTDGWGMDIMTAMQDGSIPYKHVAVDVNSAKVISSDVINYLAGGTDGDTSEAMFQSLLTAYIQNAKSNGFRNIGRYQFTHMFDPGWPLALKKNFISLLGKRQLLKTVISTQDVSLPPNTMDQDLATAEALMGVLALYPESAASNLSVTRAEVIYQCAKLASLDLDADPVPLVYKRFDQLAQYHGGTYITASPNGYPGSYINEFRANTINWVPDDEDQMAAAWANRATYAMYASRRQLFFPATRTVQVNETSLLSGSNFTDMLMYRMKLCFGIWAQVSGSDRPRTELYPAIQDKIQKTFKQAFGATNQDTVVLNETVDDANDGTSVHATITLYDDLDLRKITFTFVLERTSSEPTTNS